MLIENVITRKDNTQVKIVAEMIGFLDNQSIENRIFHRPTDKHEWELCKTKSNVSTMSVDDFVQRGRIEVFKYVTYSEILKTNNELLQGLKIERK